MRRTKRWMVGAAAAMTMTMAVVMPETARAATGLHERAWKSRPMSVAARLDSSGERSGFAGWLLGELTAFWGATRGTIIPGAFDESSTTRVDVGNELPGGGV